MSELESEDRALTPRAHQKQRVLITLQWVLLAVLSGIVIGLAGSGFHKTIDLVTDLRTRHPQALFLLPVGAVLILLLYRRFGKETEGGTNLILFAIRGQKTVPLRMAPLIYLSTSISHLAGASVGREGAALQLGGAIGHFIGNLCHFSEKDRKTMVMAGMSAAFSSMFGTPVAAAVFPMEVVSVGIMHYSALLPCTIASLVAKGIAGMFGEYGPQYSLGVLPEFGIATAAKISLLSILTGFLALLFCLLLRKSEHFFRDVLKNAYLRAVLLGLILLLLSLGSGGQMYNGAGSSLIAAFMAGDGRPWSFLLKILFTVLSICAGYKGGEIVPSFYVGAAFGALVGSCMGISPALCAAVGMGAMFCGVTNSPITSFIIMCEMFGFDGAPYYLLGCAISYVVSGYYGLYTGQKIVYSKYHLNHIDKDTL